MKTEIKAAILMTLFISGVNAQNDDNRGCSIPPYESHIEAKVISLDGTEQVSEACVQYSSMQNFNSYLTHNENDGTSDHEWFIQIAPNEQLIITSEFAAENKNTNDPNGFIRIQSGEIDHFQTSQYQVSYGSCFLMGDRYIAEINSEIELEIESPTYYASPIKIHVTVVEPEELGGSEISFINQLSSNKVIVNTHSTFPETIHLYAASGKLVKSITLSDGDSIELNDFQRGMYFVRANINGTELTDKIVLF